MQKRLTKLEIILSTLLLFIPLILILATGEIRRYIWIYWINSRGNWSNKQTNSSKFKIRTVSRIIINRLVLYKIYWNRTRSSFRNKTTKTRNKRKYNSIKHTKNVKSMSFMRSYYDTKCKRRLWILWRRNKFIIEVLVKEKRRILWIWLF